MLWQLFEHFYAFDYVNPIGSFSSFSTISDFVVRHFVTSVTKNGPPCPKIALSCADSIMEPVFSVPKPDLRSTRASIPLPFQGFSPTRRIPDATKLLSRFFDPDALPIRTIFHANMRHSFSFLRIDLQTGLRYNISIKFRNFSAHPPIFFEETGGNI